MNRKDVVVIKYLIEHDVDELNILQVSKGTRMDYKTVHSIIMRLEKESIVKIESFGQSSRIVFLQQVHPLIFEAEYERREELLKNKNLAIMQSELKKKMKIKNYMLLLFGSYAKRKQKKDSDIDLMFIVPNGIEDSFEKDVHRIAATLPLPIHYHVFSETQFREMIDGRESNVGKEAFSNNIILHSIEAYYALIS